MRTQGTGTIRKLPSGSWHLRVWDPVRGKQVSKTVKGTEAQAKRALVAFQTDLNRGNVATSGAMTFGDYLDEKYVPHVKATKSPETARNVKSRANRIKDELGAIRLDKLNAAHLDGAYIKWAEELKPNSVRLLHGIISAALSQGVKWQMIPKSPAPLATVPAFEHRESTMPSLDEITKLVDQSADSDPVLSAAVLLAALTGLRRGELLALRWTSIDRERMTLRIAHAIKRGEDDDVIVGTTKTRSVRLLAIEPMILAVLDTHRQRCEKWAAEAGCDYDDECFIFSYDPDGRTPVDPDVLTHRFSRLASKAGCAWVRFHDLRHAVATTLISQGYDPATVGARLGHSNPVITMRVYAHALEARDRQAAGVMSLALLASQK